MANDRPANERDRANLPASLRVRWTGWRNRVLASRGFQKWMAALPLTRPVARRRAAQLFDLVAGFTYTQVLLAAVECGLLTLLGDGPADAETIAEATGLERDAAERLVRAAAAIGLAEEVAPGWWMLGQQGAALQGNSGALAMIRHHSLLYRDLADPLALLRQGRAEPTALSNFWSYAAAPGEADRPTPYSELMAASQHLVAEQVLAAYSFAGHNSLLDIGGGHGAFLRAVAERHRDLQLGLFDLPEVIESASSALESESLAGRLALHPGDFFRDPIPGQYDLVSLVRILHDHDDQPALDLLRRIRAALAPGAQLLIAEPMAGTPGAERMGDAYFGLYLWAMRSGRPRRAEEIGAMLQSAGFSRHRRIRTRQPLVTSIIVATA